MRVISAAQRRAYVMISPVADGSAAAECIVRVRVWAYGGTKSSQRCAFEGGAGRGAEAAAAAEGAARARGAAGRRARTKWVVASASCGPLRPGIKPGAERNDDRRGGVL